MPEYSKNQLLRHDDRIIRVLAVDTDVLTIDCLKRTMPQWMPSSALYDWEPCDETALPSPDAPICDIEELTPEQCKVMHERYTLIAPVLPFIHKEAQRSAMITQMAELNSVSKQTIRKYLCLYSFDEICKIIQHKMGTEFTAKHMSCVIATNVNDERNPLVRLIPLPLKNAVMKAIFDSVGEKKSCLTLSNLGQVKIPEAMAQYVRRFDFILGVQAAAPYNCGMLSYGDTIYIYPLCVLMLFGGLLIYLAINRSAREIIERKLFF